MHECLFLHSLDQYEQKTEHPPEHIFIFPLIPVEKFYMGNLVMVLFVGLTCNP